MGTLEEKFLVGSYTPVGCATCTTEPDQPPVESVEASGKRKKSDSGTPRTEPPKKKAKQGGNKENKDKQTKTKNKENKDKQTKTKKEKGRLSRFCSLFQLLPTCTSLL